MLHRNLTHSDLGNGVTSIFAKRISRDNSPVSLLPKGHQMRRKEQAKLGIGGLLPAQMIKNLSPKSKKYQH